MADPATIATTAAKAAASASRFRPWATVTRHNRLIGEEYEDLVTWARDDRAKEASDLVVIREKLSGRNLLNSGQYALELRAARDEYARRWRDRRRAADRRLAAMKEAEGVAGRLTRWLWRKPWPVNPWEDELRSLAAEWDDETRRAAAVAAAVEAVS